MLPPSSALNPANVILFEILYLSSKNTTADVCLGWGAFPIVNGDFEINTGKFKLPLLYGGIDWDTNKFKDIENKYMRNIDEWLCNLYIEVKKVELFDFRYHEEKIEFTVPKKWMKKLVDQKERTAAIQSKIEAGEELPEDIRKGSKSDIEQKETLVDESASDYSSDESEGQVEDELDYENVVQGKDQQYVDDSHIKYHTYQYVTSKDANAAVPDAF
jgi:hypothetical protein